MSKLQISTISTATYFLNIPLLHCNAVSAYLVKLVIWCEKYRPNKYFGHVLIISYGFPIWRRFGDGMAEIAGVDNDTG